MEGILQGPGQAGSEIMDLYYPSTWQIPGQFNLARNLTFTAGLTKLKFLLRQTIWQRVQLYRIWFA
jgi:hypothetical protein